MISVEAPGCYCDGRKIRLTTDKNGKEEVIFGTFEEQNRFDSEHWVQNLGRFLEAAMLGMVTQNLPPARKVCWVYSGHINETEMRKAEKSAADIYGLEVFVKDAVMVANMTFEVKDKISDQFKDRAIKAAIRAKNGQRFEL